MPLLYAFGSSDEAIYFAITICALFNFYNRWIDASELQRMFTLIAARTSWGSLPSCCRLPIGLAISRRQVSGCW